MKPYLLTLKKDAQNPFVAKPHAQDVNQLKLKAA